MNPTTLPPLKIQLKPGKDHAIGRFHPWIFSGAIRKISGNPSDGMAAEIFSSSNDYLGSGIYQDASIAVRLLTFAPERTSGFGLDFWENRLRKALEIRIFSGLANAEQTNVYRLVHGEGDLLPGLVIDHYNGHLVIQAHATGIHPYLPLIAQALKNIYADKLQSVFDKSRDTLPQGVTRTSGLLAGKAAVAEVMENGHRFRVDFEKGQKTGFFIDQRDNRQLLGTYSKGRRVLNTFCYSGGFSVYALKAGASLVHSVDSSANAIELAMDNVALNPGYDGVHEGFVADTLSFLEKTVNTYDLIVLDPPAYAKHTHVRHNALQGYKRLNLEAIKRINPGGILFTFSCSQVVDLPLFQDAVTAAGIIAGRQIRVLHQLGQPADHPVSLFHPEGRYLKGLVLLID